MVAFESLGTVAYSHFMVVSYIIHFQDKARYWLKIAIFRTPFSFGVIRPPVRGPRRNIAITFGTEKLE